MRHAMNTDTYTTLSINSPTQASRLLDALKKADIDARISPIEGMAAVKVEVNKSELADAIKISETYLERFAASADLEIQGMSNSMLIPVDFSEAGILAVKVAFSIAKRLNFSPILLHAFLTPSLKDSFINNDEISFADNLDTVQMSLQVEHQAVEAMASFVKKINGLIADNIIPNITFSYEVQQGIPEEVIIQYCRVKSPALVVMAPRCISRRSEELVGSVTAEVADSCRVPLLAVPDSYQAQQLQQLDNILFFCNLDQQDFISMELYQKFFNYPKSNIHIVPMIEKRPSFASRINAMVSYFNATYPDSTFTPLSLSVKEMKEKLEPSLRQHSINMIIVPDKKRNIFTRIFNPSIPHRILFERDVPMLVVPV